MMSTPSRDENGVDAATRHRRAQSCADVDALDVSRQSSWSSTSSASRLGSVPGHCGTRTMEEKKEILGSMLGNVDALVEGVRKAGIWGLG